MTDLSLYALCCVILLLCGWHEAFAYVRVVLVDRGIALQAEIQYMRKGRYGILFSSRDWRMSVHKDLDD